MFGHTDEELADQVFTSFLSVVKSDEFEVSLLNEMSLQGMHVDNLLSSTDVEGKVDVVEASTRSDMPSLIGNFWSLVGTGLCQDSKGFEYLVLASSKADGNTRSVEDCSTFCGGVSDSHYIVGFELSAVAGGSASCDCLVSESSVSLFSIVVVSSWLRMDLILTVP